MVAQKLTKRDAVEYLKIVEDKLQDKRETYNEFLEVLKESRAKRFDISDVIHKVKELFKGQQDLLLGFNAFLPKGFEMTLLPNDDQLPLNKPLDLKEATSFINKVKARFQDDDRVYKSFLGILQMYKEQSKSITDAYHEVAMLLRDHQDLLVGFAHFFPQMKSAKVRARTGITEKRGVMISL